MVLDKESTDIKFQSSVLIFPHKMQGMTDMNYARAWNQAGREAFFYAHKTLGK